MKSLFTILSLLILTVTANAQWTVVSQVPSNPNINSISVVDQNVIWVACDANRLYKTTNGGTSWLLRNTGLPTGNLYGISALDTTTCWVGTVSGSIYKTTNGGSTWTLQFSLAGSFTNGLKMFNANYGVYYGDPTGSGQPYQFRYTTNGGTNWLLSPTAPIAGNEFGVVNAWDWIDTTRFWIGSANLAASATTAKVYKTSSGFGGGNWSSVNISGTGGAQGLYYQAVAFTDANNGMAGSNGGDIRKTTDGGNTWQNVTNPPGFTAFAAINFHGMKDGSNAIRVSISDGLAYKIFRTTNLGAVWTEEVLPALGQTNGVQHMQFINANLGFSGGNLGLLMRYGNPSGINTSNSELPADFSLGQNYPNPFNPSTKINFSIPVSANVSLRIFDAVGREVATLLNEFVNAGNYTADFIAPSNMNSGVYFYTLTAGDFKQTKKLLLVK